MSAPGSGKTLRLRQLFDVSSAPAANGSTIQWEESEGAWKPKVLTASDVGALAPGDVYSKAEVYTKTEADAAFLPSTYTVPLATESTDGLMSAADKTSLDGLVAGGASISLHNLSARAGANALISGSYADVSGCAITLDKTGTWLIMGHFGFLFNGTGYKGQSDGRLLYNGVAQNGIVSAAIDLGSSPGVTIDFQIPGQMMWLVAGTSGQVAKLQVKTTFSGGYTVGTETSIVGVCLST